MLLGRLHGVPTPANALVEVGQPTARKRSEPGSITEDQLLDMLNPSIYADPGHPRPAVRRPCAIAAAATVGGFVKNPEPWPPACKKLGLGASTDECTAARLTADRPIRSGLATVCGWPSLVMKSVAMNEMSEAVAPPSLLAKTVAHVLIGLLVTAVAKALFKRKLTVAIVAGLVAFAVHQNFDSPVARKLSELGL